MSMPRKGRRTIVVGNGTYYWTVSSETEYIAAIDWNHNAEFRAFIQHSEYPKARIWAAFRGDRWFCSWADEQTISISPRIVRQVIEYAVTQGWRPELAEQIFYIPNAETLFPNAAVGDAETEAISQA